MPGHGGGDHHHGDEHAAEHALHAHGADGGRARRMALSLGVTAAIMLTEAVGGWLASSLALISDAGHMLTDVAALALALVAIRLGSRPADEKRTYGYRRAEVLAAQINVAALVGLVGWIGWEAVDRLRHPHHAVGVGLMAGVAAVGLGGNLLVLAWLRHDHSLNARSAFLHVLGDAISSVAVLGAALAMWLNPSLQWLDPALSLLIALLILWGALRLVLEITDILMESVPAHLDVAAVCRLMEQAPGVVAVHDLHIWTISSGSYALSAHLVVGTVSIGQNDRILDEVKSRLRRACGIDHTTLQIESAEYAHLYDVHSH
ncbi:MAG TPA: cation diffusion facilitator family transporter [Anaeromyxobacteraceae bacterium]|nr:cation diffusion facilitator family transporter [Anaeromyxobacteraceae bacterium]